MSVEVKNKWHGDKAKKKLEDDIINKLQLVGELVSSQAKLNAPVNTGTLRDSIDFNVITNEQSVIIGTNVEYACLFGTRHNIITKNGTKSISKVNVGDYVLTQTGDYKKVINKYEMICNDGTNIVDIEVVWRNGNTHKISVTDEHKILVFRDGRNKWIKAGELLETDLLYTNVKIAHNKGKYKYKHLCKNCNKEIVGKKQQYCSNKCKIEYWNNIKNPHSGMKRTNETKRNISASIMKRLKENPKSHINYILAKRGHITSIEKEFEQFLVLTNKIYKKQFPVNGSYIDFAVLHGDRYTFYEMDGGYWHKNQKQDIERDKKILSKYPDAKIIHIHHFDERHSPRDLIKNPIENVYYVSCNPGFNSFYNPEKFMTTKIVSLKKWTYKLDKTKKNASRRPKLYDLSVEDIHSYNANGVIVSNSFQEFGTRFISATHFLQNGLAQSINKIKTIFSRKVK